MDGWLGLEAIRDILDVNYETLKKQIQRGKYTQIRKIKMAGKGSRNGQIWQINIADPAIPEDAKKSYIAAHISTLPAALETPANLPAVTPKHHPAPLAMEELKRWQRVCVEARLVFIRLIEQAVGSGIGVSRAIYIIYTQAAQGTLPPQVQGLIKTANQRAGDGRALSQSILMKWWGQWQSSGHSPLALAPVAVERITDRDLRHFVRDYTPGQAMAAVHPEGVPPWLAYFLDEYRRPSKPSLVDARRNMKRLLPPDLPCPSIGQMRRICGRLPKVMLEKGRMTGAEYKSIMGFAERDARSYDPFTICQIDGHSFKAYVAHPTTGAHFHPEVCGVICLTTHVLAGWSWGLAESWRTVADAFRHACTVSAEKPWGGVMAILEPDRGAGNMAGVNSDEVIGLFARVGTTVLFPERGGNPQGHGAIERSNQSIWIRAAKKLPTYTGKDMDRGVRKRVYIKLEKDLKAVKNAGRLGMQAKTSELLLAPDEFTQFLLDAVIDYNNTPHSALAKITDPQTGRRRNMTPFEALAERTAQGWQPVAMPSEMLPHLFMPHEQIKVRREKFTLRGNTYHAYELCNYHGRDDLIAAYDIHNAEQVWIMDGEERYICAATWNGNRVHARPVPQVEQAMMQREERRTKNLENKLEMVRGEADPALNAVPLHRELPEHVIRGEIEREEKQRQEAERFAPARALRDISNSTEVFFMIQERVKVGTATEYQLQWKADFEEWEETRVKRGLLKADPYCLNDPEEEKKIMNYEG